MSSLDTIILIGAFLLLAMQGAEDAAEQLNARRMRRLCCPWRLVGGHGDDATFWNYRTAGRVVSSCLLKALDVGYSRAVPALVPTAMLMLLVVRGTTSSDILLNGALFAWVWLHLAFGFWLVDLAWPGLAWLDLTWLDMAWPGLT